MRGATSAIGGVARALAHAFVFAFVLVILGTLIHQTAHALVARKFGARITRVEVAGLGFVPRLRWEMPDRPARVHYEGRLDATPHVWTEIAGPGTTWLISFLAALSVRLGFPLRAYARTVRRALVCFGLDVWLQTLPAVGIDLPGAIGRDPHFRPELLPGHDVIGVPRPLLLAIIMLYPIVVWLMVRRGAPAGKVRR